MTTPTSVLRLLNTRSSLVATALPPRKERSMFLRTAPASWTRRSSQGNLVSGSRRKDSRAGFDRESQSMILNSLLLLKIWIIIFPKHLSQDLSETHFILQNLQNLILNPRKFQNLENLYFAQKQEKDISQLVLRLDLSKKKIRIVTLKLRILWMFLIFISLEFMMDMELMARKHQDISKQGLHSIWKNKWA